MPTVFVTAPPMTTEARARLAAALTSAAAANRQVPAEKVQIFFDVEPHKAEITAYIVAPPAVDGLKEALEEAAGPLLAPSAGDVQVHVKPYAPDHTAKAGKLRT